MQYLIGIPLAGIICYFLVIGGVMAKIFIEKNKFNVDLKVFFDKNKFNAKWVKSHELKGRIG